MNNSSNKNHHSISRTIRSTTNSISISCLIFSLSLLLQSCEDPSKPDPDVSIVDIRPEPTFDESQIFGREFQLTRDSRIELVGSAPEAGEPLNFSRFSGKIIISKGKLAKYGHQVTVDSSSIGNRESAEGKEILGPGGFNTKFHPNFLITLYDVTTSEDQEAYGKARVLIGDISFQMDITLHPAWNGELLLLDSTMQLPISQQFGPDSPLSHYFGREAMLNVKLVANSQSDSESILNIGTRNLPTPHRKGAPLSRVAMSNDRKKGRNTVLFESLDTNNDKKVSKDEAGDQWPLFESADLDSDKSLTQQEFRNIRSRVTVPTAKSTPTRKSGNLTPAEPKKKPVPKGPQVKTESEN